MSTLSPVFVEFRCTRCWVSNCADSAAVGTESECRNCGQKLSVPEATPDRIARALTLLEEMPDLLSPGESDKGKTTDFNRKYNEKELIEIAKRESFVPLNQMDFQGYPPASLMARFIANLIDNALLFASIITGVVFVKWLEVRGLIDSPLGNGQAEADPSLIGLLVLGIIPVVLIIVQWVLISTSGQTIGKKLLMIRIVSQSGKLPGFVQGVVLRNWLRCAFNAIPFFAFLDWIFIFTASSRCLHDYIAGTRVVAVV